MTRSTLGRLFFAIAIVASGIQQLVTADFVRLVPPLPAWIPSHATWAYLVGVILIVTGGMIGAGRGVRGAGAALAVLLSLDLVLLLLPLAAAHPGTGFLWTNPCKALAILGGAILLAGGDGGDAARSSAVARLFLCGFLILAGVQHFVYAGFVAQLVPAWIPGTRFWVYFTAIALIAGGVGMLLPKTARLAATMSGVMMFLWVVLLHIPLAVALHSAAESAGIFEALALSGVAFLLADRGWGATSGPFWFRTMAQPERL
jgi:uncharacterized membrane protein